MSIETAARRRRWMLRASSLGLAIACAAAPAFAQDTAEVGEVIISGTRTIRDGSQAPTPVTVIGAEELERTSPRNMAEGLASLPAFRGSNGTNTPALSTGTNNTGSFLNLRNLGNQRTLVLLDGRRLTPSANNGAINFNLIPQSLVQRVDVVTGGASAAFGSDAVAGVVNVVLQTNFEGIKGSIQGGRSSHKDLGSHKATLTFGKSFMDDRLHFVASVLYNHTDPILSALGARDWASDGDGRLIIGTGATQYSDIFKNVNQNNYRGGVILVGAANGPSNIIGAAGAYPTGVKFLEAGAPSPYDRGTFVTANNAVGGDGSRNTNSLAGGLDNANLFTRLTYDATDNLSVYFQVIGSKATNVYQPSTNQNVTATAMTIFEGNPYIPPQIATLLAASAPTTNATGTTQCGLSALDINNRTAVPTPLRCFKLSRIHQEDIGGGVKRITNNASNTYLDATLAFNATLSDTWRLSGYYEHGENDFETRTQNNAQWERFFAAVDAVANPAVGGVAGVAAGTPVCRVSITNPGLYPGCQPFNPFGFNSPSQAALNYVFVTSWYTTNIKQDVAALDLAGDPFELPAGPLSVAVGAEYRHLVVDQTADPGNTAIKRGVGIRGFPSSLMGLPGIYNFGNASVFKGDVKVKEAYFEATAPLLKDLPLAQSLDINMAGRYTDYSNSGGVKTYKIGAVYSPVESLRLRATYSRDIRAPSPIELFQGNGQGAGTVQDRFNGDITVNILGSTRGNVNLKPEEADTYAAGIVFTPSFLPGFVASLDYYDITLKGAIGTLTTQATMDQCYGTNGTNGNASLCANIVRAGPNTTDTVISILQPYLNLQELTTSGFDLELNYRTTFDSLPGNFNYRLLVGYLRDYSSNAVGSPTVDSTGQVGAGVSNPRWRAVAGLTWTNGPVSLTWEANYIGPGIYNKTLVEAPNGPNTIVDNYIPFSLTHDFSAGYKFGEDQAYEAFLTINNVFDTDPPNAPGTNSANFIQSNFELYETIGRYYTAGLRFRF